MSRTTSNQTAFALALPLAIAGTVITAWLLLGAFSWSQPQGPDFAAFFALEGSRLRDLVENFLLPTPAAFLFAVWLRGRDWNVIEAMVGGLVPLLLVAFGTEILQWWIPGRNASLWDAILMSGGAAFGALAGALAVTLPQGRAGLMLLDELQPAWVLVALWVGAWVLPGHLELSRNMLVQGLAPLLDGGFNLYSTVWVAAGWFGAGLLLQRRLLPVLALPVVAALALWVMPGRGLSLEFLVGAGVGTALSLVLGRVPASASPLHLVLVMAGLVLAALGWMVDHSHLRAVVDFPPPLLGSDQRLLVLAGAALEAYAPLLMVVPLLRSWLDRRELRLAVLIISVLLVMVLALLRWALGGPLLLAGIGALALGWLFVPRQGKKRRRSAIAAVPRFAREIMVPQPEVDPATLPVNLSPQPPGTPGADIKGPPRGEHADQRSRKRSGSRHGQVVEDTISTPMPKTDGRGRSAADGLPPEGAAGPGNTAREPDPARIRMGVLVACGVGVLAIAVLLWFVMRFPQVPYNVRELFGGGGGYRYLSFPLFLLAAATLPAAAGQWLARQRPILLLALPLVYLAVWLPVWILLEKTVTGESLNDILGSSKLGWPVFLERSYRFSGFAVPLLLIPMAWSYWLASNRRLGLRQGSGRLALMLLAALPLFLYGQWVVVDQAVTDNVIELLYREGSWVALWGIGMTIALITAHGIVLACGFGCGVLGVGVAVLSLPLLVAAGWLSINTGLTQQGVNFMLSANRESTPSIAELVLRWSIFQVGAAALLGAGWRLARTWFSTWPDAPTAALAGRRAPGVGEPLTAAALMGVLLAVGVLIGPASTPLSSLMNRVDAGVTRHAQAPLPHVFEGRIRGLHPRILFPSLANWDGVGVPPLFAGRAQRAAELKRPFRDPCAHSNLEFDIACWLVSGDSARGSEAVRRLREMQPELPDGGNRYGNGGRMAFAYDLLSLHPDMDTATVDLVQGRLEQSLDAYLSVLADSGPSLWHGRTTLAANAWLVALALEQGRPGYQQRVTEAQRHFLIALEAISIAEAWPGGYNYWINSRAFNLILAMGGFLNGVTDSERHPAIMATLRRIGLLHLYALRPDGNVQGWGDEGPRVDMKDETQRVVDLINVLTGQPELVSLSRYLDKRYGASGYYKNYRWAQPLLQDPDDLGVPGVEPGSLQGMGHWLPEVELFGPGAMNLGFMRSGWKDDDTFISFRAGAAMSHHGHYDAGHFTLFKGTPLAVNASSYAGVSTPNRLYFGVRTVAKNSLLILRKGDDVRPTHLFTKNVADGGQRLVIPTGSWLDSVDHWRSELGAGLHYEGGRIEGRSYRPGSYVHVAMDLTDAYDTSRFDSQGGEGRVYRVRRGLLYLIGEDRLVVHDQVDAVQPGYTKKWLLHTMTKPVVSAPRVLAGTVDDGVLESDSARALVLNDRGSLVVDRIAPRDAVMRLVGGPNHRFYVESDGDDSDIDGEIFAQGHSGRRWFDQPQWRLEIQPGAARASDRFLVVLSPGLVAPRTAPVTAYTPAGGKGSGFSTGFSIVYAADRMDQRIQVTPPGDQQTLYVMGLLPGTQVSVSGQREPLSADNTGLLVVPLAGVPLTLDLGR